MEEQHINVQGHMRDGVAVRPYVRRNWFTRKPQTTISTKQLEILAVDSEEAKPPKMLSPAELKEMANKEIFNIKRLEGRVEAFFSTPMMAGWAVGSVAVGATAFAASITGLAAVAAAAWFLIPTLAFWAAQPLLNSFSRHKEKKISRDIEAANKRPSQRYLDAVRQEFGEPSGTPWSHLTYEDEKPLSWWKKLKEKRRIQSSGLKIHPDGTSTLKTLNTHFEVDHDSLSVLQTIQLYPKVSLTNIDLPLGFKASNTDLRGADFSGSTIWNPSFRGSLLEKANFENVGGMGFDFTHADLRNANFKNANLPSSTFTFAQLEGANFEGATITDLTRNSIELSDDQIMRLNPESFKAVRYDRIKIDKAIEFLGVSEKQFEFLVLSGALPLRDSNTLKVLTENFDPTDNHVTRWDLIKAKRSLNV